MSPRALLSVSNKSGVVPFAKGLVDLGFELLSTGGTAKVLREAGLAVTDVSDVTGFAEVFDGRVKTLHPKVHGAILRRRGNPSDDDQATAQGIGTIDLVVVNLYPFSETVAKGADFDTCIENIDIGGPAMVRASAKNHRDVTILVDPADYDSALACLGEPGGISATQRRTYAAKAYAHTAAYDAAIANWFNGYLGIELPEEITFGGQRREVLRYGENPHQIAAVYDNGDKRAGVVNASQLQGKALSYNNLNDTDAAFEAVAEFSDPAVVIVKHANPCGVAVGDDLFDAYERALACDRTSAFGGIIAVNRTLDGPTAAMMSEVFTEVIIAPSVDDAALAVLAEKKNLRLLVTGGMPDPAGVAPTVKTIAGGLLVQGRDSGQVDASALNVVTKRAPTQRELTDLLFAFRVAKHVKSNAIIYARDRATIGIGAGQMSRVDSSRIAAWKGEGLTEGTVVASDAFFPFADGLEAAIAAGATAVIQPGGSMRDDEVIAAADKAGVAMVFTGMRHFRH